MSTTLSGFVVNNKAALIGSAVIAAGAVEALSKEAANVEAQANLGNPGNAGSVRIDLVSIDAAKAGYAKNAGVCVTLTTTTAITINLLLLAAATGVKIAGDTVFATINQLVFVNLGAVDLVLSPSASNPFGLQLTGTTPTLTVAAGSTVTIQSVAGLTLSGTVKNFDITPTAGGLLGIYVGGA